MSAAVIASHYVESDPVLALDSFNRPDDAGSLGTADVGGVWEALAGTMGIVNNTARNYTPGTHAFATLDTGASDCTVKATIVSGVGSGGGVSFRATNANNLFFTEADSGGGYVYKVEAGAYSIISSYSVWSPGDIVEVVLEGSSIIVVRNSIQVASVTSTFNQSATKHGLRDYGGAIRLDDFSVTL